MNYIILMGLIYMNKYDKILIMIVFIIALLFIFVKKINNNNSNYAYVYYENKEVLSINLNTNDTYTVNGYNGEVVIEVKDRMLRVKEENSPLHICSKQGYVSKGSIICLPNKIVIKLDNEIDGVVG